MSNMLRIIIAFILILSAAGAYAGQIDLSKSLNNPGFNRDRTSIMVMDAESGEVLASHNPDLALNPASCMKILTAAAALSSLGPDYRFKTDFLVDRPIKDGRAGTLYVTGTGDPSLVTEELWRMARDLYDTGLRRVTDGIVIDDSYFDSHDFPMKEGNEHRSFASKTSAVAVNFNLITVVVSPGDKAGAPAIVNAEPPADYFHIVNQLTTGGKHQVKITSEPGDGYETLTVSGQIPQNVAPTPIHKSVADPIKYAGSVIKYVLNQNGIEVLGAIREGPVQKGAVGLLSEESKPLGALVQSMNKFSNNFMAEQILKHLGGVRFGRPGSTSKGIKVVQDYLTAVGIPQDSYSLENGSGLSGETRISADQLARILSHAYRDFTIRPEFVSSLSILGVDGTTRRWSFASTARGLARVKTGTLGGVSTLAGYVPMRDGRTAAFAILANGIQRGPGDAHKAQLGVVRTISEASQ